MQAEMLDTVVSSNSQELSDASASSAIKLFANPQFRVRVIMRCADPWFVAKDACDCLAIADASQACKNLDDDEKQVVTRSPELSLLFRESSNAPTMTLISESGLYTLIMRSNKPEAKVFRKWVTSEVLPSIRKTGGYGIRTVDDMINDPDTAIRLLTQLKIMRLQNDQLAMERDEAIRTKALIGSRREATAMNTASQKSKECAKLTAENAELKDAVGRGTNWRTVAMMTAEWIRDFGHVPVWQKLKLFSADLPKDMQPVKDVEVKVVLKNGSEKVNLLTRYHREAWAKYREFEENLRVSAESRRDALNEGIGLNDTDTDLEVF